MTSGMGDEFESRPSQQREEMVRRICGGRSAAMTRMLGAACDEDEDAIDLRMVG